MTLQEKIKQQASHRWEQSQNEFSTNDFKEGANFVIKEYEEKLCWIPIDKLENPTIPFLGKDKFGKIELFKVANVFYLKAMDIVEWRSIL